MVQKWPNFNYVIFEHCLISKISRLYEGLMIVCLNITKMQCNLSSRMSRPHSHSKMNNSWLSYSEERSPAFEKLKLVKIAMIKRRQSL